MNEIKHPVLIIAAGSDIGAALAQGYASRGCELILTARDPATLATLSSDLELRHRVGVKLVACDVVTTDPDAFFDSLGVVPGTVVMVAGLLGDQAQAAVDTAQANAIMATNYNGPARLLLAAARRMTSGTIIGISSVAGDRGRASNFVYGSAKAGFSAFLSGLRNAHFKAGLHVLTVKPGFVATKMTAGMDLPPLLTAQPRDVAEAIIKAQLGGRNVIYTKSLWWLIMTIIRHIPEAIFKRLSL
ncbi:SDR family oxidoreductase [Polymorphobacter arshaanensis]|uniref:SDR family oxidoreductase n=1 Tax=Glacieibacterium arshaanense TaxID=2511025 RepID=A0A4Y9EN93_9SPHN|nr:SDR family oxidoreductase [Polymorphobacter arshaanensis]TFU03180.1 SDR family oxidoreductase [Polymorphobacter arshaanensis]